MTAAQTTRRNENQELLKNENIQKFLGMISKSEGTNGDYKKMVYGTVVASPFFPALKGKKNVSIPSLVRYPNILVKVNNSGLQSSAAGKYQIIKKTFAACALAMGLTDFSENTQDLCAVELLRGRKGAIDYVLKGDIKGALTKTSLPLEWASLAGAGYGQHENRLSTLVSWFDGGLEWANNHPGAAGGSFGLLLVAVAAFFF